MEERKLIVAPAVYALIERTYGAEFAAQRCEKYVYVAPDKPDPQLAERCDAAWKRHNAPKAVRGVHASR